MTADDDPNEAYEVAPMDDRGIKMKGWFTVLRNGIPIYHGPREVCDRYVIDPEYRRSLKVIMHQDRKPTGAG